MSCTTCAATYYLKTKVITGTKYKECVNNGCGNDYWLDSTSKKCISSCFLDDGNKFRSSVVGGLYKWRK